ncbi:MAG: metabolite traffic protein EboE [Mariniblastus sp.]|nr:metabolite traffic protein EboE [Mariniblastus sp.]
MTNERWEPVIGYCTNVHAGTDLAQVHQNLQQHTLAVKQRVRPAGPMGIGLWLSHAACRDLFETGELTPFADWLAESELLPFTFNGFPYSNFHQPVVKHDVYLPDWTKGERLAYTLQLAEVQAALLATQPASTEFATISTLPLGWPRPATDLDGFQRACAKQLLQLSEQLDQLWQQSGVRTMVCLEPEPGCLLDTAADVARFFEQYLLKDANGSPERILRHIGVCHDVCHSSVMFESQETALQTYADFGIEVGKYQVSSAVEVNFDDCPDPGSAGALLAELGQFSEPRYLHQTTIRTSDGQQRFFEDLPLAFEQAGSEPAGTWRVHFHVPLFAEHLGAIGTTQADIGHCLQAIRPPADRPLHFELETYAWTVLPESLQVPLAVGIAQEIEWFDQALR